MCENSAFCRNKIFNLFIEYNIRSYYLNISHVIIINGKFELVYIFLWLVNYYIMKIHCRQCTSAGKHKFHYIHIMKLVFVPIFFISLPAHDKNSRIYSRPAQNQQGNLQLLKKNLNLKNFVGLIVNVCKD